MLHIITNNKRDIISLCEKHSESFHQKAEIK